ncbi:MAG: hypothetical protein H0T56_08870 [Pseudaminobacter sp.]|nr:hypothetical protein [Pseudaminobacter sp.]
MTIRSQVFHKLALSAVLFTVPLHAAFAQDANAVAERLKKVLADQSMNFAWTGVSGDASSLVLEGVTFTPAGGTEAFALGKVTLDGVTDQNGGYRIETISTEPYNVTEDGATIDVGALTFTGVVLPPLGAIDPVDSLLMYEGAELANVSVKMADQTAFSMDGLSIEVTPPADGAALEFSGSAESFTADLTLVEDPQSKAVIEALGYQTINGDFELAGSWQPTDGRISLSQYDISVEDAGTFGLSFELGGYTPAFLKSLQDMQKQMAAQPEGADNSAQGLAMLGLMQQLTFHTANIRFDDDSLTGKILEYVAKQQNMKPEDIANQAKAIVPFLAGQLNNPELSAQITTAVTKYLDAPASIEIDATPAAPVPFALIAAGGMANPMELPKTLGVTVTANEAAE